jgi:hypothetical protein
MGTTAAGLVMLGLSLALGLGAAGFLSQARAITPPEEPTRRTLAGTVVEVLAAPCFVRGGEARQTWGGQDLRPRGPDRRGPRGPWFSRYP